MKFGLLNLFEKVLSLFNLFNIDYHEVKKIVEFKILLSFNKSDDDFRENKKITFLIIAFLGLLVGFILNNGEGLYNQMSFIFGILILYMIIYMTILFYFNFLDSNNKEILSALPLKKESIFTANKIFIGISISYFLISFSTSWIILGVINYNLLFIIALIISLILVTIFTISIITFIYGLIIKIYNGNDLKKVLGIVPAIILVLFAIGITLLEKNNSAYMVNDKIGLDVINYLLPNNWYGGIFELIVNQNFSSNVLILSLVGLICPLSLMYINHKFILGGLDKKINKKNNYLNRNEIVKDKKIYRYIPFKNKVEEASFYLYYRLLNNDKKFKFKFILSGLAAILYSILFIFEDYRMGEGIINFIKSIRGSEKYLSLYLYNIVFLTGMGGIFSSSNSDESGIFKYLPVNRPSDIIKGLLKGYMVIFAIPSYLVISVIFTLFFGINIIPFAIVAFINLILASIIMVAWFKSSFYFSYEESDDDEKGIVAQLSSMFINFYLGLVHFGFIKFVPLSNILMTSILGAISILTIAILWKKVLDNKWEDLVAKEGE